MPPKPSNQERSLIQVAVVEDDVDFQSALTAAMKTAPDMRLLGAAGTRAQGLRLLEQVQADVLLVDLGLPDGSGIDVIRAAHVQWPECNIMVSTIFGDEAHVMQSLEAGASGYLLKDSSPDAIVLEIRCLHAGGSPISPMIARQLLTRFRQPVHSAASLVVCRDSDKQRAALSEREREVLEYITKGFTSNEIAALMSISHHTVLTYVRRIYAKLEVNSKAEAIYETRIQGLLA
ncbi:MAG: response regulator transcription factor [Rhodoferax sp.]|nr:response regulator transcription factor [Rhodoferax sp.]